MSEPAKPDSSTQTVVTTGSKPHLLYKCLLNQYSQKLKIPLPAYQTHNEGVDHLPKFRSTIWIDGMTFTSSNTFPQRKMAEMDVSKIAFLAITQKLKDDASHHVREDKSFCKSILVEYAARMNIDKPTYQTTKLEASFPVFRSLLSFAGVSYNGDSAKSKKEAEQLVARTVILKYIDSDSGNVMSEIVNCKFRHYAEMNKLNEVYDGHNGNNSGDNVIHLNEARGEAGTLNMPYGSTEPCLVQGINIPATSLPLVVTQPPIPEVSTLATTPVMPVPLSSNITQQPNLKASSGTVAPPLAPLVPEQMIGGCPVSSRKRNRKNKKNAQKKMRVDAQLPTPLNQVTSCSVAQ